MTDNIQEMLNGLDKKVQDVINKTNEEVQSASKIGRENKEAVNSLESQISDLNATMAELSQNGVKLKEDKKVETVGNQFVNSDAFKNMQNGSSVKARFEIQNNTLTGSDATVAPDRQTGIVGGAFRQLRITDVLNTYNTTSNAIEYTRENVFTNNAAEAAEGTQKAESVVDFELVSVPVRTIAHFIKLSKQIMDDAPALASYVDGRMRYGVELREENQIISGDGVGANLSGLLNSGNYTVFTAQSGESAMLSIRRAIAQVKAADYAADVVILNPQDAMLIDIDKATDGHFINNPASVRASQPPTAWGLPVVESNAMPEGQFLVGSFAMAAALWARQGVVVDLFEQDGDNAQKNLVTLRAEKRCALSVYRPASLVGGTLTAV